jgi:hypothetical protein
MSSTDRIEDVEELEVLFGRIPIEIFIRNLANQLEIIKVVRETKPWLMKQEKIDEMEEEFIKKVGIHPPHRTPNYKKEERTKVDLL